MIPASDPLYYNPGSSSFSDCEGSENWSSRSAPRQSCGTHQNKMSWKLYWAMECCMCVWMCVCVSASGSFVENVTTWRPVEGHYRIVRGLVQCSWSSDEGSEEEAGGMSIGTGHLWDSLGSDTSSDGTDGDGGEEESDQSQLWGLSQVWGAVYGDNDHWGRTTCPSWDVPILRGHLRSILRRQAPQPFFWSFSVNIYCPCGSDALPPGFENRSVF